MREGRAIGIVGVLLVAIGGLLLLVDSVGGLGGNPGLERIAQNLVGIGLAIAAFVAAAVMYRTRYSVGGLLAVLVGAAIIIVPGGSFSAGILVALGGVLGIVAAEVRT